MVTVLGSTARTVQPGPVFLGCLGTTSDRPEVPTALQSQPPPPTALTVGLPSLGICSWRSQVTQKKKGKLRAHNLGARVCSTDATGWTTFLSLGFSSSSLHPLTPHRFLLSVHTLSGSLPVFVFFSFFLVLPLAPLCLPATPSFSDFLSFGNNCVLEPRRGLVNPHLGNISLLLRG